MKRLYVGNVPYDLCTDEGLRELFEDFDVESTHIVMNKELQRPRGFCFVETANPAVAQVAIEQLNGVLFHGRNITVRLAHDRPEKHNSGQRRDRRNEQRARH